MTRPATPPDDLADTILRQAPLSRGHREPESLLGLLSPADQARPWPELSERVLAAWRDARDVWCWWLDEPTTVGSPSEFWPCVRAVLAVLLLAWGLAAVRFVVVTRGSGLDRLQWLALACAGWWSLLAAAHLWRWEVPAARRRRRLRLLSRRCRPALTRLGEGWAAGREPLRPWTVTRARAQLRDWAAFWDHADLTDGSPEREVLRAWLAAQAADQPEEPAGEQDLRGQRHVGESWVGRGLQGARLGGADFSGVVGKRLQLQHASVTADGVPRAARFEGADLSRAYLLAADLPGCNFRRAKLVRADASTANLAGADLSEADLSHARLDGAKLGGAVLRKASGHHARLCGADLTEADLADADLRHARLADADLSTAKGLVLGSLGGADLTGARLPAAMNPTQAAEGVARTAGLVQGQLTALLLGCLCALVTAVSVTDLDLLLDTSTAGLPLVSLKAPLSAFLYTAPLLLIVAAWLAQSNLIGLADQLVRVPARLGDGRGVVEWLPTWLPVDLLAPYLPRLGDYGLAPASGRGLAFLTVVWGAVPLTVAALGWRALHLHSVELSVWLLLDLVLATVAADTRLAQCRAALAAGGGRREPLGQASRMPTSVRLYALLGCALLCLSGVAGVLECHCPTDAPDATTAGWHPGYVLPAWLGYERDGQPAPGDRPSLWRVARVFGVHRLFPVAELTEAVISGRPKSDTLELAEALSLRTPLRGPFNLRGAHMARVTAVGCTFRRSDLSYAQLTGADLRYADLRGARLREADLRAADLRGADLRGADLTGADLSAADLRDADLTDASLARLQTDGDTLWPDDADPDAASDAPAQTSSNL